MTDLAYSILPSQVDALLTDEHNTIANLANAAALLKQSLPDVNWAGFYIYDSATDTLDLGPFQGNVACMHIQNGNGVCGTAFKTQKTLRIKNVHDFKGHIACDSASNSEIVIPITKEGQTFGVLDIDSPSVDRFTAEDEAILTEFVNNLVKHLAI